MKPFEAILYGLGAFGFGLLMAFTLMLVFADVFEFNEQLDRLYEHIKAFAKKLNSKK
jgi:hypothetical protein